MRLRCGLLEPELAPEAVSGRGEVYSYTVNHQSWDGGTEPYAIVLVALPEQDGLRLTSNLTGCDPDDVEVGMPVRVRFEQHDEVWVPVFVVDGGADPTRDDAAERVAAGRTAP